MARSHSAIATGVCAPTEDSCQTAGQTGRNVFFRALVDLGTGGVAGIEAAHGKAPHVEALWPPAATAAGRMVSPASQVLGAWGREVREPAAYMVRGGLATRPDRIGQALGLETTRVILMFDVADLLVDPSRALDVLVAGKQAGARILLDNFDLETPPCRFLELLPADILRVSPGRMPWHWDDAMRRETLESLAAFAANLLMDVAVIGLDSGGRRRDLRRLGVRYAQGGWRRDTLGLVPDPVRL